MKRVLMLLALVLAPSLPARAAPPEMPVLTLDEALRIARTNHPQLQAARAQTEASAARVGMARAPLLPQLSGNASYTRSSGKASSATSTGLSVPLSSGNSYSLGVNASQLLYDFGLGTGKYKAAQATLGAQEQTERNLAVHVAFNLRSAYYTAAAARALLKVAEETLHNRELHLRQIQAFVEVGKRPEIDLVQSRTDRANAQVQLIQAQVAYDTDRALLNQAMGVERDIRYDIVAPPAQALQGEDGDTVSLLEVALSARPDVMALARQIDAQELSTRSIRGGYAPSLSASAGVSENANQLDSWQLGWNARLLLSWQLFGGGITDGQVRESRASTAALRAQYELLRQQVRVDVEQARLAVRAAKAAIAAAHEAAQNARVRLTLAEGRYQAGVGNVIELSDSQVALTSALAQEVQAIFTLDLARARLLRAIGQL